MTQETNYTAESSTSVRIQKMNKMACWTLHGTGRNMYHWEMAGSHLHKGNCRVIHKHYYFCNGTVQVWNIQKVKEWMLLGNACIMPPQGVAKS